MPPRHRLLMCPGLVYLGRDTQSAGPTTCAWPECRSTPWQSQSLRARLGFVHTSIYTFFISLDWLLVYFQAQLKLTHIIFILLDMTILSSVCQKLRDICKMLKLLHLKSNQGPLYVVGKLFMLGIVYSHVQISNRDQHHGILGGHCWVYGNT